MNNLLNATIEILDGNSDVKAFVYQQIAEFDPYVTNNTTVSVVARDPRKLAIQLETDGKYIEPSKLKSMFRIAIVMQEDDTKLEAEGLHEDVFEAIRIARDTLMKKLTDLHDKVISNQDRMEQINYALSNPQLH